MTDYVNPHLFVDNYRYAHFEGGFKATIYQSDNAPVYGTSLIECPLCKYANISMHMRYVDPEECVRGFGYRIYFVVSCDICQLYLHGDTPTEAQSKWNKRIS